MSALQPGGVPKSSSSLNTDRDRRLTAVAPSGGTSICAKARGRLEGGHGNCGYAQYGWLCRPGPTSWCEDSAPAPCNHQARVGVGELIGRGRMRLSERELLDPGRWQLGSMKPRIHVDEPGRVNAACPNSITALSKASF